MKIENITNGKVIVENVKKHLLKEEKSNNKLFTNFISSDPNFVNLYQISIIFNKPNLMSELLEKKQVILKIANTFDRESFLDLFNLKSEKIDELNLDIFHQFFLAKDEFLELYHQYLRFEDLEEREAFFNQVYKIIFDRPRKLLNKLSKIAKIENIVKTLENSNNLFIGFPYLIGNFKIKDKRKRFVAPLLFWQINLTVNFIEESLTINLVDKPKINLSLLNQFIKQKANLYEPILKSNYQDSSFFDEILTILKFYHIKVEKVNNLILKKNHSIKKYNLKSNLDTKQLELKSNKKTSNYNDLFQRLINSISNFYFDKIEQLPEKLDPIRILNIGALGFYGNFNFYILNDYYQLEDSNWIEKIERLLIQNEKKKDKPLLSCRQISALDKDQYESLKKAINNDLLIIGPTKSGKTKLASNIIVNILLKNNNILFISNSYKTNQQIANNLGKLNQFAFHINEDEGRNWKTKLLKTINSFREKLYENNDEILNSDKKASLDELNEIGDEISSYKNFINNPQIKENVNFIVLNTNDNEIINLTKTYQNSNLFKLEANEIINLVTIYLQIYNFKKTNYNTIFENRFNLKRFVNLIDLLSKQKTKLNLSDLSLGKKTKKMIYKFFQKSFPNDIEFNNLSFKEFLQTKNHLINSLWEEYKTLSPKELETINKFRKEFLPLKQKIIKKVDYKLLKQFVEECNYDIEKIKIVLKFNEFYQNNQSFLKEKTKFELKDIESKLIEFQKNDFKINAKQIYQVTLNYQKKQFKQNNEYLEQLTSLEKLLNSSLNNFNLKTIFNKYYKLMRLFFPIIIAEPNNVPRYFRLNKNEFDTLIIDDANNLPIYQALPIILRSNHYIVLGNNNEINLNTDPFFKKNELISDLFDTKTKDKKELVKNFINSSLLEFASRHLPIMKLTFLYNKDGFFINDFINRVLYDNTLHFISPNLNNLIPKMILTSDEEFEDNTNIDEANKIVDVVVSILKNDPNASISIVTTNPLQKRLIYDQLLNSENTLILSNLEKNEEYYNKGISINTLDRHIFTSFDYLILNLTFDFKNPHITNLLNHSFFNLKISIDLLYSLLEHVDKNIYVIKSFNLNNDLIVNANSIVIDFFNYLRLTNNFYQNKDKINQILNKYSEPTKVKTTDEAIKIKNILFNDVVKNLKENLDPHQFILQRKVNTINLKYDLAIIDRAKKEIKLVLRLSNYVFDAETNNEYYYIPLYFQNQKINYLRIYPYSWFNGYKDFYLDQINKLIKN